MSFIVKENPIFIYDIMTGIQNNGISFPYKILYDRIYYRSTNDIFPYYLLID